MSKVKEITIAYGLTVNTGNYESTRIDVGATVTLDPGETEDQAMDKFMAWAKRKCHDFRNNINGAAPAPSPAPWRR